MLKISIRSRKGGARADAWVTFAVGSTPKDALAVLPAAVRAKAAAAAPAQPAAEGAVFTAPLGAPAARLYVFGGGKSGEISPRKARALLRTVAKTLNRSGEKSAILDFPFTLKRMDATETREFLLRALALADYSFPVYKTKEREKKTLASVSVSASGAFAGATSAEARDAGTLAEVAAFVRDLGNTPSNDLVPRDFARRVAEEARARGLKAKVLDKKAIRREKMGGLLAVNRGSAEEPRVVVLEWNGGKRGDAPLAFVGKGVTFDSGGISIKPSEKMGDMKWDMMGAATAMGIVLAAADLKLPVNIVGVAALTENLPSGTA